MSDLYKAHSSHESEEKKKKTFEEVVSLKKELGSGWAKEVTKLSGKAKYAWQRRATLVDLDKCRRKLSNKDTSTFALNALYQLGIPY